MVIQSMTTKRMKFAKRGEIDLAGGFANFDLVLNDPKNYQPYDWAHITALYNNCYVEAV